MNSKSTSCDTNMKDNKEKTSFVSDTNTMVATLFNDVSNHPVPRATEIRFAEIRRAIAEGLATTKMALDIIRMFPDRKAA